MYYNDWYFCNLCETLVFSDTLFVVGVTKKMSQCVEQKPLNLFAFSYVDTESMRCADSAFGSGLTKSWIPCLIVREGLELQLLGLRFDLRMFRLWMWVPSRVTLFVFSPVEQPYNLELRWFNSGTLDHVFVCISHPLVYVSSSTYPYYVHLFCTHLHAVFHWPRVISSAPVEQHAGALRVLLNSARLNSSFRIFGIRCNAFLWHHRLFVKPTV